MRRLPFALMRFDEDDLLEPIVVDQIRCVEPLHHLSGVAVDPMHQVVQIAHFALVEEFVEREIAHAAAVRILDGLVVLEMEVIDLIVVVIALEELVLDEGVAVGLLRGDDGRPEERGRTGPRCSLV